MVEIAESAAIANLTGRIDELSTRLIVGGVASLGPGDFEVLGQEATELGCMQLADTALHLAASIASRAVSSVPERTRLLSFGLVELKRLLDEPDAKECPAMNPSSSAQAQAQNLVEIPLVSPEMNSLAGDEGLIGEFITESSEHLVVIEKQMLILEKDNTATEILNAVFRGFHTIKGLAGFLEFSAIQSLAHEVETLLDLARTGTLTVTPFVVDVILESTDVVRQELANIELRLAGKTPPPTSVDQALLQRIRDAARGEACAALEDAPAPVSEAEAPKPLATGQSAAEKRQGADRRPDSASIRIDTRKLDRLMDMVGEMVTLIGHSPALTAVKDAGLMKDLTQLARITADVQRIATGMRMVPIGIQFQKTARLVRDLSRRAGKRIELETSGEHTELDKTIAEELSDPLLHMVRNSIDHGIETPEERAVAGKHPAAHIRIAAYCQSGQIVIAISDDGRGLNRERILAKALQNGLIQPGAQLTDNEIFLLIFEAGFSTAEKITDISGRGVGMDVVRRHVQKLRGRIEIQSKAGQGTTFYLKLPLTLPIVE